MSLPEPLLTVLNDPNVAYILFLIGIVGVIAEAYHPGALFPGITGVLALILGLLAFSLLSVNLLGVALILLAVGLFLAEAHTSGMGLLGLAGAVTFVTGSLLLFAPFSSAFGVAALLTVSPLLIGASTLGVMAFFLLLLRASLRTRRLPITTGPEALLGKEGIATSALSPSGVVRVDGEDWSAIADVEPINSGERVEIIGVEGVTLRVHRPHEWRLPEIPSA
ncbi:MAG TPA: NfeD family protein [Ktedonobacterales bacterium]|jgi:membrane-bound serine protease (ClpP class)|nr:NfeD family protein [Ktedonobacterales bacterium]